jgi:hypothetical protein
MYTGAGAAVPIVERVAILQILTECEDVKQRLLWDHKICRASRRRTRRPRRRHTRLSSGTVLKLNKLRLKKLCKKSFWFLLGGEWWAKC